MMEIGRQILISSIEKRKHLEIICSQTIGRRSERRPTFTCPGDVGGWKEVTSVTSGFEQNIYLAFATFYLGQTQCS